MRLKAFSILISIILLASLSAWAQNEDEGDGSRGSFLSTRPSTPATTKSDVKKSTVGPSISLKHAPMGIGYTLYMRDESGKAVRADSSMEFRSGEAVRITLEPNTSGYLYVFHTENDGVPTMLFPDSRLNDGRNAVRAHVPCEIPSSLDPNPTQRWFVFDDKPAAERLYVVFSRQPLADVPTEAKLLSLCRSNPSGCPLHPSDATWSKVKTAATAPVKASRSAILGQAQSDIEKDSIGRGLGIPREAPSPSVINMAESSTSDMLVTTIDLKHK
jgi:uncharacterized protein DUF4384